MANNRAARRSIINAWNALLGIQSETPNLSNAQKAEINASIAALKTEYLAVMGLNPTATYAEITNSLTNAKQNLEKIREDRKKLQNALVTAKNILGAMTSVLGLIA